MTEIQRGPAPSSPSPVIAPRARTRVRDALRLGASPVTVVTTVGREGPHGMTVTFTTPVSLSPPTVLVCLATGSRTQVAVAESGRFAVNYLAVGQEALAEQFAEPGADRFVNYPVPTVAGVPVIPGCLASLVCDVVASHTSSDHHVVVGRVVATEAVGHRQPLIRTRGRYAEVSFQTPGAAAVARGHKDGGTR